MKPSITYWGDRLGELRRRFPGTLRAFARFLDVSHLAVHKWTSSSVEPRLAMAVRISLTVGYTLDNLTGPDPLAYSRDFEPRSLGSYGEIAWIDQCVALVPGAESPRAAMVVVAARSGLPLRTVSGWLYDGREPLLSCAREVAIAFGVSLHGLAVAELDVLANAA